MDLEPIAHIQNDFPTKFGLPRQSGMSEHLLSRIIMEKPFREPEAFRGIEDYTDLWLVWLFDPMGKRTWSPTVRPPRLGGNRRLGVFATRSPNRPNPIGLTRVKLVSFEPDTPDGPVLTVAGADLKSGTAILDIKPYIPYADSEPEASSGLFAPEETSPLTVEIPERIAALFSDDRLTALREVLSHDPRPRYHSDPERIYGFSYAGYDIKFRVEDGRAIVTDAIKEKDT